MDFAGVYLQVSEGYIAFVEELPGANTQGTTLEEARENLQEAILLVQSNNQMLADTSMIGYRTSNPADTRKVVPDAWDLERHLLSQGCSPVDRGRMHWVYHNPAQGQTSTIPWHRPLNDFLARKICRDLGVPEPIQACHWPNSTAT